MGFIRKQPTKIMKHSDEFFATLVFSKDYNSKDDSCPEVHNMITLGMKILIYS